MEQVSVDTKATTVAKPSVKEAMKVVKEISEKAAKAAKPEVVKRDNTKKLRAHDIITTMRAAGQPETAILKALQDELAISYPNAYYYTKRVFTK